MLFASVVAASEPLSPILNGEAEAKVWVDVVANIAVGVSTPFVDLGQVASGEFSCPVVFTVHANVEQVTLCVIATDLYKGDDPNSPFSIPVLTDWPAEVYIPEGNEVNDVMGNGDNKLVWMERNDLTLNGFSAAETECSAFESSQGGRFSQPVTVTVCYDQIDDELPTGEYSGYVKLIASIEPPMPY